MDSVPKCDRHDDLVRMAAASEALLQSLPRLFENIERHCSMEGHPGMVRRVGDLERNYEKFTEQVAKGLENLTQATEAATNASASALAAVKKLSEERSALEEDRRKEDKKSLTVQALRVRRQVAIIAALAVIVSGVVSAIVTLYGPMVSAQQLVKH